MSVRNIVVLLCALLLGLVLAASDSAGLAASLITEYSRQEFVDRVAQTSPESRLSAEERVAELEAATGAEEQYAYCEYVSTFDYGAGYVIDAGVLFLTKAEGKGRQICGVVGKWTGTAQNNGHQWSEAYHVVDWAPTQIVQMIRGRVAVSIRMRSLASRMLRLRLWRLGFQEGIVLDRAWHSSKTSSWRDAYLVEASR